MNEKIITFQEGIFSLHTRRFGTVAELMIQKLYKMNESNTLKFDKTKDNYRIEIKFSRALKENTEKINIPVEITQTLYITHDKDSFPFVFFTPNNISYKIINQGLRKMTFKPAKQ